MSSDKRHSTGNWEGAPSLHGFFAAGGEQLVLQASDYKAIPSKLEQLFASCFSDENEVRGLELFQSNKHRGEKKEISDFPSYTCKNSLCQYSKQCLGRRLKPEGQ